MDIKNANGAVAKLSNTTPKAATGLAAAVEFEDDCK